MPIIEEVEELFLLVDKNRSHLREFLGWVDYTLKVADSKKFIQENLPLWLQLKSLHLSIRHGKKLVGAVGFPQIDFVNHSAFIGYWLDEAHQGKGIMTKAIKALMVYGFEVLKLHRMQILCATHNKRSEKVALSLEFNKEGILKEAVYLHDQFFDAYLYGKIN